MDKQTKSLLIIIEVNDKETDVKLSADAGDTCNWFSMVYKTNTIDNTIRMRLLHQFYPLNAFLTSN